MPSAIEQLDTQFKDHMRGVNELIIQRFQSEIALIPKIASYLVSAGGKRIRPLLTLAAASFAGDDKIESAYGFAAAVEFIHTATLLHDDVVDESEERRGKETANLVFGNQATVLVGDYLFSKAFELMVESKNLEALKMLSQASATIAEGEVMQLSHIGNIAITYDDYIKIIESKTAALFRAATKSGTIISGQSISQQNALYNYGHHLGICFQIADDLIDYTSTSKSMGKVAGDDFREGKITLPALLAINAPDATKTEQQFWQRCFSDKQQDADDFQKALEIIKKHSAIDKSFEICERYMNEARENLKTLPDTTIRNILDDLLYEVVHRAK